MDINALKVDSARAATGDWVDGIPGMGSVRFKVRGFSSPVYRSTLSTELSKVPRDQRVGNDINGDVVPEVQYKVIGRVMAGCVLLDWDGLTEDEKPMPFDQEKAIVFLTHPDYRLFREAVTYAASVVEKIEAGRVESAQGN